MSLDERIIQSQTNPFTTPQRSHSEKKWTSRSLFRLFQKFRINKEYAALIDFLIKTFPNNVKNKTFNFTATGHLFHSLYAYVPSVSELIKERKQIRLQEECISKLFKNTINDFKLYTELFDFIEDTNTENNFICPCQLLTKRLAETKSYVENLNCKQFDSKPPKFKKEPIDNILYKYSLNWKSVLLKKKDKHNVHVLKRKKKSKQRHVLTNEIIYLHNTSSYKNILCSINGLSLKSCIHEFTTIESQTKAGDEIVSFIRICKLCQMATNN
ncbi:Late expression factor 5 [Lonomia obliqua multiple nucleopolyhedrovirus]|uniref:Late expression factor 5 n=1 Tax=Lonomia obliqua multiple nucleopolyhedrovirus TaxID=134394 RepID=A0A126FCA9_9ABAC|nr:Late expression factor 5 [Lonomia obliqua multiple nucleopolyhedrovirus]AKN81040.1 Late expression factor 5 [Lonomia obliqua multiple nucleopolyhedrovirus]